MDNDDQKPEVAESTKREKLSKSKNGFSVPVKKSDTFANETKSKSKTKTEAEKTFSCTQNTQHQLLQKKKNKNKQMDSDSMASTSNGDEQKVTGNKKNKKKKSDEHKNMEPVLTEIRLDTDEQKRGDIPKKRKKELMKGKNTDCDLTASNNDTYEQKLDENSKKRKKNDVSTDKDNLIKKRKKKHEQKEQINSHGTEESVESHDNPKVITKSKTQEKTKKKKTLTAGSFSKNDVINCVLDEREEVRAKWLCFVCDRLLHYHLAESHQQSLYTFTKGGCEGKSQHPVFKSKKKKSNPESTDDNSSKCKDKSMLHEKTSSTELCSAGKDYTKINDEQDETGTWVQCSNKMCNKWRYLADVDDPLLIPENWDCTMNSDQEHNSCDVLEVDYSEGDHIYTKYTIGSVVWAKMNGYPWWPAMVECDPDTDTYYEVLTQSPMVPLQYHVTFFDDHVTRSWIKGRWLTPYIKDELPNAGISAGSGAFQKEIKAAMKNAKKALTLSLKKRTETFGFLKRFSSMRSKSTRKSSKKGNCTKKDDSIVEDISKVDYVQDDLSDHLFEEYDYIPKKTASRGIPSVNKNMKQKFVQEKAAASEQMKDGSEDKTTNTVTPDKCETSRPDKSSKKDSCVCIDDISKDTNYEDDNIGGKNCPKRLFENTEKLHKKKYKKKLKLSKPEENYHHGYTKNINDCDTELKRVNDEYNTNDDTVQLVVSNNENKCANNDKAKQTKEHKISRKSHKINSKGQMDGDQKDMTDDLRKHASSLKVKKRIRGSTKKERENIEEFSETNKGKTHQKIELDKVEKTYNNSNARDVDNYIKNVNENNSESDKREILFKENVKSKTEEIDTLDEISSESADGCAKKSTSDKENKSSETAKNKCVAETKEENVGRKQTEEDAVENHRVLKCHNKIKTKKIKYKKGDFMAPYPKVTIANETSNSTGGTTPSTHYSSGYIAENFKTVDRNEIEADQQIVPDIGTEIIDDYKSCSDLAFSNLTEKNIVKEHTSHYKKKHTFQDRKYEDGKELDWNCDSIKLNMNSPKKLLYITDNCCEDSDDFILHLEAENTQDIAIEKHDNEYSVHGQYGGNCFFEFGSESFVDLA